MPDEQDPQTVRTETTNEQVAAALARQSTLLRLVLERLDEVVQLLTPKPSEGPTLDELLAGLVSLVQHQLRPGGARPALNGAGANGTGDRR